MVSHGLVSDVSLNKNVQGNIHSGALTEWRQTESIGVNEHNIMVNL